MDKLDSAAQAIQPANKFEEFQKDLSSKLNQVIGTFPEIESYQWRDDSDPQFKLLVFIIKNNMTLMDITDDTNKALCKLYFDTAYAHGITDEELDNSLSGGFEYE